MSETAHAANAGDALVRLTEWNLATLEGMQLKVSTPKRDLKRQKAICEAAVGDCARFASWAVAQQMGCHRLARILDSREATWRQGE